MLYKRLIINGEEYPMAVNQAGAGAPAAETEGAVGLLYMDTDTGELYKCTAVEGDSYTWEAVQVLDATLTRSGQAADAAAVRAALSTLEGKIAASVSARQEVLPNVVLFGDSITDTAADGDWVTELPNYAQFASLRNYARGFATFTFKSDSAYNITDTSNANIGNNVIWNQFNRLKNDVDAGGAEPDVIVIVAGTNDIIQSKTLGDADTAFSGSILDQDITELTNFAQSIRYVCECIKQAYPMCQIILCTPWQMSHSGGANYREMIISCARKLSEKYIDIMYESGVYQYFETTGDIFKDADGIHLSALGGKKTAQFMARELYNKVNLRQTQSDDSQQSEVYAIKRSLIGCTSSGSAVVAVAGSGLSEMLTAVEGYTLEGANVSVTMGGEDISSAYSDGSLTIEAVTGNVVITVVALSLGTAGEQTAYLRDELAGTFTTLVQPALMIIPDVAIPAGTLDTFEWNAGNDGELYFIAGTFDDEDKSAFTPSFVKLLSAVAGENVASLGVSMETEFYVGFRCVTAGALKHAIDGATSSGQHYTDFYAKNSSSFVPEEGVSFATYLASTGTPLNDLGLDCLVRVTHD